MIRTAKNRKSSRIPLAGPDPAKESGEIIFSSGTASSKQPHFEYVPYQSSVRIVKRFELGLERKGKRAWNALQNQQALTDMDFILSRIGHVINHAYHLQAILLGQVPDDGDDHAAAIGWSGHLLCEATRALKEKGKPNGRA